MPYSNASNPPRVTGEEYLWYRNIYKNTHLQRYLRAVQKIKNTIQTNIKLDGTSRKEIYPIHPFIRDLRSQPPPPPHPPSIPGPSFIISAASYSVIEPLSAAGSRIASCRLYLSLFWDTCLFQSILQSTLQYLRLSLIFRHPRPPIIPIIHPSDPRNPAVTWPSSRLAFLFFCFLFFFPFPFLLPPFLSC